VNGLANRHRRHGPSPHHPRTEVEGLRANNGFFVQRSGQPRAFAHNRESVFTHPRYTAEHLRNINPDINGCQ